MSAANKQKIEIVEYYNIPEEKLYENEYGIPTSAYAVVSCDGKYLLGFNKYRNQWEFPAGKIEKGESARDAAKRELFEETHQIVEDLEFRGMFKIYDCLQKEYRFRAIYYGNIGKINEFVATKEDEMTKICLWDFGDDSFYVDEVDCKLIKMSILDNNRLITNKIANDENVTRVIFVRHAQPVYDENDRIRPLSEEGLKDREIVLENLKGTNVDAFLCSPYKRSIDTIKSAADYFGLRIMTDERLRERLAGNQESDLLVKRWEDFSFAEEGGESLGAVQKRKMEALVDCLELAHVDKAK